MLAWLQKALRPETRPSWPLEERWPEVMARLEAHHNDLYDVLAEVVGQVGAARGSLMLLDEGSGELVVRVTCGPGAGAPLRLRLQEGVAGSVASDCCPMVIDDALLDPRVAEPGPHLRTLLCVPLAVGGQTLGVMNLCDKAEGFTRGDLAAAMRAADEAAASLFDSPLFRLASAPAAEPVRSRARMRQLMTEELERSSRYHRPACLLSVALDATHRRSSGAGDAPELDARLCALVANAVRRCDVVGRLEPGVLGVLLPETEGPAAQALARRLVARCDADPRLSACKARVRVGICSFPKRALGESELVSKAQLAMRMAGNGGPRVQLYRELESPPSSESQAPARVARLEHLASRPG